jgi:hypothetical protein
MRQVRRVATRLPLSAGASRIEGGSPGATGGPEIKWQPGCQEKGAQE